MTTLAASDTSAVGDQSWMRLFLAIALSLLLHLALLIGIPVNPTGGVAQSRTVITARLESAPEEAQSESPSQPADAVPEPQRMPGEITASSTSAADVERKPTPEPKPALEPKPYVQPPATPSAGIDMPLIRDPTYYPTNQLDVYPQPVAPVQLPYPESAVAERVEGSLLLLLLIDEFGMVSDVSVVDAQPAGYFEEAARKAFRSVRFSPAMKSGYAVKSRIQFRIRYTYDTAAEASR